MELVQFGSTPLKVTRIGLGLAALGRPGYINLGHAEDLRNEYDPNMMEKHAHDIMSSAYRQGVRYFDAARSYGKAEQFLASWIADQSELVVGSKWGYTYTADWQVNSNLHEVKEHSLAKLEEQWEESFDLLGKNLKIYHIHSATRESGVLENSEVIEKLWQLKEQGLIVGLSTSGAQQAETIARSLEIRNHEGTLFQSVQATWNLLERSTNEILQRASDSGYGIIVKEALANGRLTERNKDTAFAPQKEVLHLLARKYDVGIDAIALAAALDQPWSMVVLSGAASRVQLESNIKAVSIQLDASDRELLESLEEDKEKYWETRSKLAWN